MKTRKCFMPLLLCAGFIQIHVAQTVYPNGLVVNSGTSGYGAWITDGNLYVDGSQCIGVDCDTFTTFGFSTVILKENNTRITFDDTSAPGSGFPDTDWELVANESDINSRNEFRIDDLTAMTRPFRITGGAPSNSLVTGANGFLGVGVLNPLTALHLVTGNTPTIRLQDIGPSPYTWDIIANEINFGICDFSAGGGLSMQIRPSAPAQSIYIENNGNVGLGTSTPSEKLEVNGNALINGNLTLTGQVLTPSDIRLKSDILPIDNALGLIAPLEVKKYYYRQQSFPELNLPGGEHYGLIAQEVESHLPQLVSVQRHDNNTLRHVDYMSMIPILVQALQELDDKNQALTNTNKTLEAALQKGYDQIEQMQQEVAEMRTALNAYLNSEK